MTYQKRVWAARGLIVLVAWAQLVCAQLPDDIQRELNQNLAEQARIQAMRQRHQQQLQSRAGGVQQAASQPTTGAKPAQHDPNNYSYQQVSPPIQYSYYQPYGDAAQPQQPQQQPSAAPAKLDPQTFDLNNLNFELPQPQAQVSAAQPPAPPAPPAQVQHLTPSFTGAGGLPVMQPVAAAQVAQPRVQQGPPLTEADFKDITGGENYGAPGGQDFGLAEVGAPAAGPQRRQQQQQAAADQTDVQLREFGFPGDQQQQQQQQQQPVAQQIQAPGVNMADFGLGDFGSVGPTRRVQQQQQPQQQQDDFGFGAGQVEGLGGAPAASQRPPTDFDFAIQPSASQQGGGGSGDPATSAASGGGAPGSLQSLLGAGFPGLSGGGSGGNAGGGLDEFAGGSNDPQQQQLAPQGSPRQRQADDGSLEIADLGDKSDQFSGADLGGFEQPSPRNDQDFNYAAAASQQPSVVPYPDGAPQPVGTLLALTQPQSMTQTRYSVLPDKGTFQDYPAYLQEPAFGWGVRAIVDRTPRARRSGPGRYGQPARSALAPEYRQSGGHYDYSRGPLGASGYE